MQNTFDTYKNLLKKFVSFKSISTDPKFEGELEKTAQWLLASFKKNKFKAKLLRSSEANPVVFASYNVSPEAETVIIYGHYDVQPAEISDGWASDPFNLFESRGRLFARGVVDNKGQIITHVATVFDLIKENKLKLNVKFLIEGNEETGNDSLSKLMEKHKGELKCDFVLVSDGELASNNPTIEVSLRGGFNCTLTYITGMNNVHSGLFGGGIPNSAMELSKLLSKIYNVNNSVTFKEFYNGVDKITPEQLNNNKKLLSEAGDLRKLAGVKSLLTEKGYDFFTQTGLRPTIQITGLKSGYIDQGYANIVPAVAEARINFRLASSQDPKTIFKAFENFVKKNTPKYVDCKLEPNGMHGPIKVNINNEYIRKAESILEKVYGSKVSRKNVGGAIPFVGDVKKILGVDTLFIPLVNEDCNMHGANENYEVFLAKKGLEFSRVFLGK